MSRFDPGDRVRIIGAVANKAAIGTETIVLRGPHRLRDGSVGYEVDLPTIYDNEPFWPLAWFGEEYLEPVGDYNGNEISTWDECPFKPKELMVVSE